YVTVLEALSRQNAIRAVPTRLESSATFAAEAYAALRRKPACVFVSRAPGAANASIGVHTAMQSSRPMVLFVANIPRSMKQREAFQEIDYRMMYGPIAKAVFDVHSFDELASVTARALDLSVSGRPGPVVVAVSRDVLDGRTGEPQIPKLAPKVVAGADPGSIDAIARLLNAAKHPIVLAGEMVAFERAHASLKTFVEASGAGVLAAYRQQDVFPNTHPAWLGQLALNRTEHTEQALDDCDFLLCLGSRLDSVTTDDYAMFRDNQKVAVVYPEPSMFSQWQPDIALAANVAPTLDALIGALRESIPPQRLAWRKSAHDKEVAAAQPGDLTVQGDVNMAEVIATFKERVPNDAVMVADAGTFGRWIQRFYQYDSPDSSLGPVSGAMGYGVPGGIGAAVADGSRQTFVWVGDGGFLMTGQEAATIVQEQLPVIIIVCDNAAWGSILVYEQKRFPGLEFGTMLRSPDFAGLGTSYGMTSFAVTRTEDFAAALDGAMAAKGPALIHLRLDARDVSPFPVEPPAPGAKLGD
ncbi:MAG: hypothetical protein K0U93_17090, partial [Gammaproteobacteria bacterium]|nr:hypothetical protein [Gammaproteobacteria bacterium]